MVKYRANMIGSIDNLHLIRNKQVSLLTNFTFSYIFKNILANKAIPNMCVLFNLSPGHISVIIKRAVICSKGVWKLIVFHNNTQVY